MSPQGKDGTAQRFGTAAEKFYSKEPKKLLN